METYKQGERKWGMRQRRWVRKRRQFSKSSLEERRISWMMSDSASGKVYEKRRRHFVRSNKAKEMENDPEPPSLCSFAPDCLDFAFQDEKTRQSLKTAAIYPVRNSKTLWKPVIGTLIVTEAFMVHDAIAALKGHKRRRNTGSDCTSSYC